MTKDSIFTFYPFGKWFQVDLSHEEGSSQGTQKTHGQGQQGGDWLAVGSRQGRATGENCNWKAIKECRLELTNANDKRKNTETPLFN